jgi:hypothetical protein
MQQLQVAMRDLKSSLQVLLSDREEERNFRQLLLSWLHQQDSSSGQLIEIISIKSPKEIGATSGLVSRSLSSLPSSRIFDAVSGVPPLISA